MTGPPGTPRRMRVGGPGFLVPGAALVRIGLFLRTGVRHRRIAMEGAGLAVPWLRVAVLIGAGVIVTLQSGGRMPRLHLQAAFDGFPRCLPVAIPRMVLNLSGE